MPRRRSPLRASLLAALAAPLGLGAGCGRRPAPFDTGATDAGAPTDGTVPPTDGTVVPADGTVAPVDAGCAQGRWACQGTVARQCDGAGGFTSQIDCATTNTACVPQLGCRVCAPGTTRCSTTPSLADHQVERCADDGESWVAGPTCDVTAGMACQDGACIDRCGSAGTSYTGCEYWPTVTANSDIKSAFSFAVVVANPQTYAVTVQVTGGALAGPLTQTVMPGQVQAITLPWVSALVQTNPACFTDDPDDQPPPTECSARSSQVSHGAYHLTSNGPLAAYQFNPLQFQASGVTGTVYSYTNDASLLLPTPSLTAHYIVVTHDNFPYTSSDGITTVTGVRGGFVTLVGVNSATTHVTITTTAAVFDPGSSGQTLAPGTYTYQLQQGDAVQLVGTTAGQDLTGSVVTADSPLAVFTGHDCTDIPLDRFACDHLEEQLLPNETWGTQYVVSQLRDRGPTEASVVRIVSQRAGNALTFDGIPAPTECSAALAAGAYCEFQTAGSFTVTGTQPFLAMQYMLGQGAPPHASEVCTVHSSDPDCQPPYDSVIGPQVYCTDNPNDPLCEGFDGWCSADPTRLVLPVCIGDPAMVTEVPAAQFRQTYDFLVPDTYVLNFVNVVAPTGVHAALDGQDVVTLAGVTSAPAGAGFTVYFVPVQAGAHHLAAPSDAQRVGVKVYGVARYTAYMYPGGLDLAPITPPG